jgi:cytochrome c-type biogenesis protein CcmH
MLLLAVTLSWASGAMAIDTERAFDDPALQARYENITRELRCLVCQNETIADSNATLAGDLRREVRDMIADGKSDDQIRDFMIARYGDFVLYRPRFTPLNFLLWAAPVLLLLAGAFAVVRVVRRRAAEAEFEPEGPEGGQS